MVEVAVIGAGAIAKKAYLPALEALANGQIRWVVDVNPDRARTMANAHGADAWTTDYTQVVDDVDAAIIATPPRFHDEIAEACFSASTHVLIEKPVATSLDRAESLVELAHQHNLHFAISRQQREAPACRYLATFAHNGALGTIDSFQIRYGDPTNWPFASTYRLKRSMAGGGVLVDRGGHILDVLLWIFGDRPTVDIYRDDNFGGVEANAEIHLTYPIGISGTVELTATRAIEPVFRIAGDRGEIYADPNANGATYIDGQRGEQINLAAPDRSGNYLDRLAEQTRRFVDAVEGHTPTYVPAETDLPLLKLVETCYANREVVMQPWERKHLEQMVEVKA